MNNKFFGIRPPEGNLIWRNMTSLGEARYFGTGDLHPKKHSKTCEQETEQKKQKDEQPTKTKLTENKGSTMQGTEKSYANKSESAVENTTLPAVSGSYSGTSKQAVLEVISSIDDMNRHIKDCMESQMRDQPDRTVRLMDPARAHTVLEAAKTGLVGLKLKLDASKMLQEFENGK